MADVPILSSSRNLMLRTRLLRSLKRAVAMLESNQDTSSVLGSELVIAVRSGVNLYGPGFFFSSLGEWMENRDRIQEGLCLSCVGIHINKATGDDYMCDQCRTEINEFIEELDLSLPSE